MIVATISAGWMDSMSELELVVWLRERGYDGPVDLPRRRLQELALEILHPTDWTTKETEPSLPEPDPAWQEHPVIAGRYIMTEWAGLQSGVVDIQIKGEPGWYRFDQVSCNAATGAVWIDTYGGAKGAEAFRSFRLERVKQKANGQPKTQIHVNRKDKD